MKSHFFDAFTVISLWIRETEQALFEKIIFLVPEAEPNVQESMSVGNPGYPILSPSKSSGACVLVWKVYRSRSASQAFIISERNDRVLRVQASPFSLQTLLFSVSDLASLLEYTHE